MNIVQYMKNPVPEQYQKCIDSVQSAILPTGSKYRLYHTPPVSVEEREDPRFGSDMVRIKMASVDEDMVWIDADTEVGYKGIFVPPERGMPYFYSIASRIGDICVFYVNGCPEFFASMIQQYTNNPKLHTIGWAQWIINHEHRGEFRLIPDGHFIHKALYNKLKAK